MKISIRKPTYLNKSGVYKDARTERVQDAANDRCLGAVGIVRRADAKPDGYANGCGEAIQYGCT